MTKKPTPKSRAAATKTSKPKAKATVSKSTVKRVAKLKAAAPKPVPTPIEREEFISPPVLTPQTQVVEGSYRSTDGKAGFESPRHGVWSLDSSLPSTSQQQWDAATQDFLAVAPLEEKKPSHWKKVLVALGVIATAGVFWYVVQVL